MILRAEIKEGPQATLNWMEILYALPIDSYMMCLFCNKDYLTRQE